MNKKAITPVIAVVLLLMLTVSSAAAAYYWMTTIQSNLQQQAQSSISSTGLGGGYGISVLSGSTACNYKGSTGSEITTYISVTGSNNIQDGEWYAFVVDSTGATVGTWSNASLGIDTGKTKKVIFTNTTTNENANISKGNTYTVTINSPEGSAATTSCTGSTGS